MAYLKRELIELQKTLYRVVSFWSLMDFPGYRGSEEYYSSDREALEATRSWIRDRRPENQAKKNHGRYPGYSYEYPLSARVYKKRPVLFGRFFPIWRKVGEA